MGHYQTKGPSTKPVTGLTTVVLSSVFTHGTLLSSSFPCKHKNEPEAALK